MKRQVGFTLVEVLVAAVILFMVISSATIAYRGAVLSAGRAESVTRMLTVVNLVSDRIRADIRQDPQPNKSGEGSLSGVGFTWSATVNETLSATSNLAGSNGAMPDRTYSLYNVDMTLSYQGYHRDFHYRELAWK